MAVGLCFCRHLLCFSMLYVANDIKNRACNVNIASPIILYNVINFSLFLFVFQHFGNQSLSVFGNYQFLIRRNHADRDF